MEMSVNGALIYNVDNVIIWTKQGTAFIVGGSFATVSGVPSQQLLPSSNTTMGYFNGQMLATASGLISGGGASGLTAGALINFDPGSTDTGQQVWNGMVIADLGLKFPIPIGQTYAGTMQVASQSQGWVLRKQFLYGPGTPATDVSIVNTALNSFGAFLKQSQCMNSSNATEVIFAY